MKNKAFQSIDFVNYSHRFGHQSNNRMLNEEKKKIYKKRKRQEQQHQFLSIATENVAESLRNGHQSLSCAMKLFCRLDERFFACMKFGLCLLQFCVRFLGDFFFYYSFHPYTVMCIFQRSMYMFCSDI